MGVSKAWSRATRSGGVKDYDILYSDHQQALKKTHKYFEELPSRIQILITNEMNAFGLKQVYQAKGRMSGQKHGLTYKGPNGLAYIASAPGEPPANKSGKLRDNIEYRLYTGHVLTVQLGYFLSTDAPKGFNYGNYLEYQCNRPNLRLVRPYASTSGHPTIKKLIRNAMDMRGYMQ